jgi:phosphate transport system substrate-binding protein
MLSRVRFTICLVLAAVGCNSLASCGSPQGGLQGRIEIDGSSTVEPISSVAEEVFSEEYPSVRITVAISGTGGGFKRFTLGETDISDASRPIKQEEFKQCVEKGVEFVELPVAYDGLSIVVHPSNKFVERLTVAELQKIFLEDGAAQTWKDVNDQWPDMPLKIYAPGTDSGTFDYFKEVVTADVPEEKANIRGDMTINEDDNVLVNGVAGNEGAVGFFGAAYYFANTERLRAVPIVNPEGKPVLPSAETVESGEYAPFSRPLFIYVNLASLKRPEVQQFVEFYLKHAADFAKQVNYVALPEPLYAEARDRMANRRVGTHFLAPDGTKRGGPLAEVYVKENLNAGQ